MDYQKKVLIANNLKVCVGLCTKFVVFITTGAICISEVFMGKCSLQTLDISFNKFGDGGIIAIAGALSSSHISTLDVSGCGFTLTGARSLAAGLLVNNSVKFLHLSYNPVTVEGACLILQSALDKKVCQAVYINGDYSEDDEVKKMMNILKHGDRPQVGDAMIVVMVIEVNIAKDYRTG